MADKMEILERKLKRLLCEWEDSLSKYMDSISKDYQGNFLLNAVSQWTAFVLFNYFKCSDIQEEHIKTSIKEKVFFHIINKLQIFETEEKVKK